MRAARWRKRWREKDGLVMGGTEESRMEGEMDWSYLGRPAGTDESMWCMMGASPIRQPITDFGLNGITNHGHWLASSFPISDKPQHIVSILQAASCPVYVVSLYVYCTIHVCVCMRVCARVFVPLAVFWFDHIYLRYPYMWELWCGSGSLLLLCYCFTEKYWMDKK